MRKIAPVLAVLQPYAYFVGFAVFSQRMADSDMILFSFFALYLLFGVTVSIFYAVFADAASNFWVKAAIIPADLVVIFFNIFRYLSAKNAGNSGADGLGMALFVLILFVIPYILSRTAGMVSAAIACARKRQSVGTLHIILHLLPIADLCSAAAVRNQLQQA